MRALLACALVLWPHAAPGQTGADIVVLGEVHDNPAHHLTQARIVAEVAPAALVFEMLDAAQAAAAAGVDRSDPDALEVALGWDASGWPDFATYWPIFAAAPEAELHGAAVSRDTVMAAMSEGAAPVFGPRAEDYALGPLDPDVAEELAAEQAEAHCGALPPEMLPGMVEAQRLRDAAFAQATLRAFDATGGPVVLITGNGHARTDRGVPAILTALRPDLSIWTLGQVEGEAPEDAPYDRVVVTEPAEREDPCLAFR